MTLQETTEKFKRLAGSHEAVAEYLGINPRTYANWRKGVVSTRKQSHVEVYLFSMLKRYAQEQGFEISPPHACPGENPKGASSVSLGSS